MLVLLVKVPQSAGELVPVDVLVVGVVFVGAVWSGAARGPPEEALLPVWTLVCAVQFTGISHRQWSPLHNQSVDALDGSVTVFLPAVVDEGTLLVQQHLDAVDGPSSAEELVERCIRDSRSQ